MMSTHAYHKANIGLRRLQRFVFIQIVALSTILLFSFIGSGVCGTLLFSDSFDADSNDVNRELWTTPTGNAAFFGRTAIRNPDSTEDGKGRIRVTGGAARLVLSTHNPTANEPGDSFWGSEIDSRKTFSLPGGNDGIEFAARVRSPAQRPPGIVTSLFGFGLTRGAGSDYKDEIDFEFLSNLYQPGVAPPQVLINRYVDEPPTGAGRPEFIDVPGLDFTRFNEFAIRWYNNRIIWLVNGEKIRSVRTNIPKGPLGVRLNIWAPKSDFESAYSADLRPTANPTENVDYIYAVDWVRVQVVAPENNAPATTATINAILLDDDE